MAGILVQGVGKRYPLGGNREKTALQDVDLRIEDGEFVCLLGPSGCGKTTLLNILSGLDRDYRGSVTFTGMFAATATLAKASPGGRRNTAGRRGSGPVLSYMFQESRLLPWLTVSENLRFVLDGLRASAAKARIEAWLARVGLEGHGDYYPLQLSIGMQQRVALARALIIEPGLLFMDEPLSSLDELTALRMRKELLALWREQGCTVVFVTHNPLEAVYLADRVVVMTPSPGRIVEELDVGALLPRPRDVEDRRLWELSRRAVRRLLSEEGALEASS